METNNKLRKPLLILGIFALILIMQRPAYAAEDLLALDNGQVFYQSCASLNKSTSDVDFKKTYCFGHMAAFFQGQYIGIFMTHEDVQHDKCGYVYEKISKDLSRRFCLPSNKSLKDLSIGYVSWVNKKILGSKKVKYPSFGSFLMEMYPCK